MFLCKYIRWNILITSMFNVHVLLSDLAIPNYIVDYSVFNLRMKKKKKICSESFVLMIRSACGLFGILHSTCPAFNYIQKWSTVQSSSTYFHATHSNCQIFQDGSTQKMLCLKHKEQTKQNKTEKRRKKDRAHPNTMFIYKQKRIWKREEEYTGSGQLFRTCFNHSRKINLSILFLFPLDFSARQNKFRNIVREE